MFTTKKEVIFQMNDNVKKIHEASMQILNKTGMKFYHPDALEILKNHGIKVDGNVAYFTEDQIMEWVRKAPSTAPLYASDSRFDMQIGGNRRYNGPCGGATFIMDKDGQTRPALFSDFIKLIKLFEGNPSYCLNGGLACQPNDIPTESYITLLALASMLHTQKCIFAAAGDYESMETLIQMACIRFGVTVEELKEKPRLCTIANTNTPLYLDKIMTETVLTMAKYRQPVIIASAAMAGTTAPVTLAGMIAVVNAEVLATIALAQMCEPGAPVIYGSQSTNADMATGAIAIGSPEGALSYKYCAEMAKFYGIPSRAGGSLSDAKSFNVQAGYESMMTCMACKESGINIMTQSAGIIDSYLAVSYEKLITDFEILDFTERYLKDIDVNADTVPLDLIHEVGHAGQYLIEEHTLDYCRSELLAPHVSVRGAIADPVGQFGKNIEKRMEQLLKVYQKPDISTEICSDLKALLLKEGIDEAYIDMAVDS